MRHLSSLAVIALFIGLLASCGNNKEQSVEAEENRYGINFSDTSTIKKVKGMIEGHGYGNGKNKIAHFFSLPLTFINFAECKS